MLKYRLIFGTLMIAAFLGLLIFDAWLDGSLLADTENLPIQASILAGLLAGLAIPATFELSHLLANVGAKVFKPLTIILTALMATNWYWAQFYTDPAQFQLYYLLFTSAFAVLGVFLYQGKWFGTSDVLKNCSANLFCIFYLGLLSSFVLGIRIEFGVWALLMFVFVVKSSDIGAYTAGKLFGKHKFAPRISPGKTWEGLAGAIIFAAIVSFIFGYCCDIMAPWSAVLFGIVFAVCGQLADLAESMIKRDAQQKDSSAVVPGFGGVLDVIDSPLGTAPLAYAFLMFASA
ncbi:Phosphatidate cytidylyltransferase [Anaerohalosphaera lusitana]|uniref:Phosphatidate cytidylyltransferase n=1 Tax=Anaerohalosphaera lusitana TaxID=1936003 RepID=A0A1U9NI68_9BACT|nr:phosphatidate cytidylyltransferase [Anaerohalosphaera lusitana]AQT67623.1 Phosphatidate cytidylyltransferase [Anaerohalosphaera lusitana]